jgi:hypothetical protein
MNLMKFSTHLFQGGIKDACSNTYGTRKFEGRSTMIG